MSFTISGPMRGAVSTKFLTNLAWVAAALALIAFPAFAADDVATVRTPEAFAVSPPLSLLVPIRPLGPVVPTLSPEHAMPAWVNGRGEPAVGGLAPAESVLQTWVGAAPMPSPLKNFEGNGAGLGGFSVSGAPPDTEGDVGPNHYVQWVNTMFSIWNKSGTLLYGPADGNTLFTTLGGRCATDNYGDPLVMYDPIADRWFMSQFAISTSPYYQCVAVSKTPDPTGQWYTWAFNYGSNFNDYGKSGVWPDGYYVMYHMFSNGGPWAGTEVCAFDRVQMLAGNAGATQQCFGPNINYGGLLPSHLNLTGTQLPPAGAPNYFMAFGSSGHLLLWPFHVDWTTPANSTFGFPNFSSPKQITVAAFTEPCGGNSGACIPQLSTGTQLDTLGDRLMWRLNYRNFGSYESLVVNHTVDSLGPTAIRWYEIRSPGSTTPAVFQQGTFAPDSNSRWMGSINMDRQGNIALGYSVSSSSMNPAIRYAGRLLGDPVGTLPQTEVTLTAGTGSQTTYNTSRCPPTGGGANTNCPLQRWGDYSTMSVDPTDGCTFWYTQEYLAAYGTFNWRTRIGSFKFAGCTACSTITGTVTGGGTICAGNSSTVRVTVSGGAGPYTVTLTNGGGTQTGAGPVFNFSVAPGSTTTYGVLSLTDSLTCAGTGSGTATVTVNPSPATPVITAPAGLAAGATLQTASVVSHLGSSYTWSIANGSITAGQGSNQITFTAGIAGALALSVVETTISTGCSSPQAHAVVNVLAPIRLYTVAPCRVIDTRNTTGPDAGAPALAAGEIRAISVAGKCGVPAAARAISANMTVTGPAAPGSLLLYPANLPVSPLASNINFVAGITRANNAVVLLASDGTGFNVSNGSGGAVNFILDVNGYFK